MNRYEGKTAAPLGVGMVPAMRAPEGSYVKSVPDVGTLSQGMGELGAGLRNAAAVCEKVQAERDDLELSQIGKLAAADMRAFNVTLDEAGDNARHGELQARYMEMIQSNENLSEGAKERAMQQMSTAFEANSIEMGGRRMRMIVEQNIGNHRLMLKEAVVNGNEADAIANASYLRSHGESTPDDRAISQECCYNRMVLELDGMSEAELNGVVREQKTMGSEYQIAGLSQAGTRKYAAAARRMLDTRERENESAVLAGIAKGKPLYDNLGVLEAAHDAGELSDDSYVRIKGWTEKYFADQTRAENVRRTEQEKADKARRVQQLNEWEYRTFYNGEGRRVLLDDAAYARGYKELVSICGKDYDMLTSRLSKMNEGRKQADGTREPAYQKGNLYQAGLHWLKNKEILNGGFNHYDVLHRKDKRVMRKEMLTREMDDFVRLHPDASVDQLTTHLEGSWDKLKEMDCGEIAEMSIRKDKARIGEAKVKANLPSANQAKKPQEGATGMFRGKKVVYRQGKWEYAAGGAGMRDER